MQLGYYTIPSDNRELQPNSSAEILSSYYTIPSDNRELQPYCFHISSFYNYTIPSDNRELQQEMIEKTAQELLYHTK